MAFPLTVPSDEDQRIEVSLDQGITTPYYSFNFSYGREIGKGLSFEASYVSRWARNLLASRDIMQLNNIRDPQSGLSYYDAVNLVQFRYAGAKSRIDPRTFRSSTTCSPSCPIGGEIFADVTQAGVRFSARISRWRRYYRLHVPAVALGR